MRTEITLPATFKTIHVSYNTKNKVTCSGFGMGFLALPKDTSLFEKNLASFSLIDLPLFCQFSHFPSEIL